LDNWRKALLAAQPVTVAGRFARVEVATAGPMLCAVQETSAASASAARQAQPASLIEIILPSGTTLRVEAQVDPRALRRILAALRG
jgi:hypothetical protein